MQLPEIEALQFEITKAHLDLLREVFGAAHRRPLVGSLAREACLRRDHEAALIRCERLADEHLTDVRTIRVCSVDKVHTELNGTAQNTFTFFATLRLAPDTFAGDAHRAESE